MVSLMFQCRRCTHISYLFTSLPLHPLLGQSHSPAVLGKDIRYICGSSVGKGFLPISSHYHAYANAMLCMPVDRQQPHCQFRDTVKTLNMYILVVLVCYFLPLHPPPISRLHLGTICMEDSAKHPNFLPYIFQIPTLSKYPVVRVSNDPCSQTGSVNATRTSFL